MLVRFMIDHEQIIVMEALAVHGCGDRVNVTDAKGGGEVVKLDPSELAIAGCPIERWDGSGVLDLIPYQSELKPAEFDDGSMRGKITSWRENGFGFISGEDGETYFLHLNHCSELLRCKLMQMDPPCYPMIEVRFYDAGSTGEKYNVAELCEEVAP